MKSYMKKVLAGALVLGMAGSVSAATVIYDNDKPGWEAAVGAYAMESFEDATLNEGVSVVSDRGSVDATNEVWWDRLSPGEEGDVTTWTFEDEITSFGGNWDLANVARAGTGVVAVIINGVEIEVGEISNTYTGEFWGFVSDVPFTSVLLKSGTQEGIAETYEMDNMVYSNGINFDVHPEGCPNPITTKSKGLTPMAILGTADFDVTEIDIDTLEINGVKPVRHAYEDVAQPYMGVQSEEANRNECWEFVPTEEVPEYEGDGYEDLTLKFDTQELADAIVEKGVQYLTITGEKGGEAFTVKDVVWVK